MAETPGSISGLVKSKKYGLTFAFVSTCFAFAVEATEPVFRIVLVGCATAAVLVYVACQSIVESSGRAVEEEDPPGHPVLNGTATVGSEPPKVA